MTCIWRVPGWQGECHGKKSGVLIHGWLPWSLPLSSLDHGHIFSWNMGWQLLRAPRMELLCGGIWDKSPAVWTPDVPQLSAYPTAAPDHFLKSVSCHVIHFGLICLSWLKSFRFIYPGTPQAGQGYLETNFTIPLPRPHPESAEHRRELYAMFYRCCNRNSKFSTASRTSYFSGGFYILLEQAHPVFKVETLKLPISVICITFEAHP